MARGRCAARSRSPTRDDGRRQVNALALPAIERHLDGRHLDDRQTDGERLFLWLHYYDPHSPYILPEGFENPFLGDAHYQGSQTLNLAGLGMHNLAPHKELKYYVAQYDANILVVDRKIQEIVDRLRSLEMLDDTLIVLTSDHGESLGEHDLNLGHGRHPYNTTVHVPLIFHTPTPSRAGASPSRSSWSTSTRRYGIWSRLTARSRGSRAKACCLSSPAGVSLSKLRDLDSRSPRLGIAASRTTFEAFRMRAGSSSTTRKISPRRQVKPEIYELYNLDQDPLETENLADTNVEQLRRLRYELFEWMNGRWILPRRNHAAERSKETLEALKALGYLE